MKLGSLFDGSGGFPLAGTINGIMPVWASEIEPYPIAVTTARFPSMKHLGSITDINGGNIEPVDIITFGSPCQDLSIAGNQKGIENGARSSLFFQAIRIIKEMRDATNGVYPNYAVWENVPGAFSSNHGNDFRLVLEALASIFDPSVSIPMPEKWQRSGEIVGDGYSIAWRTLDAQFWGVPQRRKRIYLVADFSDEHAGQILFERESVCGDTAEGREAGEGTADNATGGFGGSCGFGETGVGYWQSGIQCLRAEGENRPSRPGNVVVCPDIARTLEARHDSSFCIDRGQNIVCIHDKATRFQGGGDTRDNDGSGNGLGVSEDGVEYTLTAADRHGVAYAIEPGAAQRLNTESRIHENCAPTLRANMGDNQLAVVYSVDCRNMCLNEELSGTLQAKENGGQSLNYVNPVVYENHGQDSRITECEKTAPTVAAKYGTGGNNTPIVMQQTYQDKSGALCANSHPGSYTGQDAYNDMLIAGASPNPPRKYIVRRLTPTECARLQGFPDNWGDVTVKGKSHSDSAEYKMWGNGIALPCAVFVLRSVANQEAEIGPALEREPD